MYVAETLIHPILPERLRKFMTFKMLEWFEADASWTAWTWKWRQKDPSDISHYFPIDEEGQPVRVYSSAASMWESQISQYKCFEYQKLSGRWPCAPLRTWLTPISLCWLFIVLQESGLQPSLSSPCFMYTFHHSRK